MLQLTASIGQLRLTSSSRPQPVVASARFGFCSSMRGQQLIASRQSTATRAASVFAVVAKQNSIQRQRVAEKARMRNKARKSAISTRMKKVFAAIDGMRATMPSSEDEVKPVEKLISEAYQEIDKAVSKGVLHMNTAARRKQRLAAAKRALLVDAGLYTPA